MSDYDLEFAAIKKELELEKGQDWPEVPPIQSRTSELQRKIQTLKATLSEKDIPVDEAVERLGKLSRSIRQAEPLYKELVELSRQKPILRHSVQLFDGILDDLDDLSEDMQIVIDLNVRLSDSSKVKALGWEEAWASIGSAS
ncbi:MAG TPA: hypothetical protein ENI60_06465 [Candidatus Fraserbacteria bacterium]|nr:hypothetical protein [Candidatus Fraserbacteria bacterium]